MFKTVIVTQSEKIVTCNTDFHSIYGKTSEVLATTVVLNAFKLQKLK